MITHNLDPPRLRQEKIINVFAACFHRLKIICHPPYCKVTEAAPFYLYCEEGVITPISRRQAAQVPADFCLILMPTGEWEFKYVQ